MSWIGRALFDGISGGLIGLSRFAGKRLEAAYDDYYGERDPDTWLAGMPPEILPVSATKMADGDFGDMKCSSINRLNAAKSPLGPVSSIESQSSYLLTD